MNPLKNDLSNVGTGRLAGYAVDADPKNRPGVPMELPPHKMGSAHWEVPESQPIGNTKVFKRAGLDHLTSTFGTASPPKGLSGLLRAAAYGIHEHRVPHWLLLLLADRVDVMEHRLRKALPFLALITLGVGVGGTILQSRSRRRLFG